ncbi:hypothetical protein EDD18DRAFT_1186096 [Armillaria luteobubalina]|uniref:Uncharacterized protein n=1 Tax=Armillaria luteobubalina TaxID=153913 RepID=A0AA39UT45_9AGAR|nr:hypothetical protein EDD18DRAFT_1186096 [Armillaria luteobubalina]
MMISRLCFPKGWEAAVTPSQAEILPSFYTFFTFTKTSTTLVSEFACPRGDAIFPGGFAERLYSFSSVSKLTSASIFHPYILTCLRYRICYMALQCVAINQPMTTKTIDHDASHECTIAFDQLIFQPNSKRNTSQCPNKYELLYLRCARCITSAHQNFHERTPRRLVVYIHMRRDPRSAIP